jgi:hypothetical protein
MKSPAAIWKRIILSRAPACRRVEALKLLDEAASFALLNALLDDPTTPGRLLSLAAELLVRKTARRQLRKQEKNPD